MRKEYAGLFSAAGLAGNSFDIANGTPNTLIIDVLLSAGNGILTEDAPMVMFSTGAITASRTLDITALEDESAVRGGAELLGRMFMLSVQNSDISPTVTITLNSSNNINGAATMVISGLGDYLFQYLGSGDWIASILPKPSEKHATLNALSFASTVWNAHATIKHSILVSQASGAAAGRIGPHGIKAATSYLIQVYNTDITPYEQVDAQVFVDNAGSGDITLKKAAGAPNFNGIVIISGSLS